MVKTVRNYKMESELVKKNCIYCKRLLDNDNSNDYHSDCYKSVNGFNNRIIIKLIRKFNDFKNYRSYYTLRIWKYELNLVGYPYRPLQMIVMIFSLFYLISFELFICSSINLSSIILISKNTYFYFFNTKYNIIFSENVTLTSIILVLTTFFGLIKIIRSNNKLNF